MSLNSNFISRFCRHLQNDVNRKAEIITKLNKRIAELSNDQRSYHAMHIEQESEIGELKQRIAELEAIPRDEADGYNTIIAHLQTENKRLDAALDECAKFCGRLASYMENGAGEPEPGNRLRQAEEGCKEIAKKAREGK